MKELILSILFILCLSFQASAFNPMVVLSGSGSVSAPEITDDFSSDNITNIKGDVVVTGGVAENGVAYASNLGYHSTQLSSANHYAQVDVYYTGGGQDGGPLVRCNADGTDSTGYYLDLIDNVGGDPADDAHARLHNFDSGGVSGQHDFNWPGETFTATNVYPVKLSVDGSNVFRAYIDFGSGWVEAEDTDTEATFTGTYVGVSPGTNGSIGSMYVDNLEASPL